MVLEFLGVSRFESLTAALIYIQFQKYLTTKSCAAVSFMGIVFLLVFFFRGVCDYLLTTLAPARQRTTTLVFKLDTGVFLTQTPVLCNFKRYHPLRGKHYYCL